ncbi:hypothetical protein ROHU_006621 [Labeo rohita]|uniref:Uncharacterized protein n=1 Tax=Labeo rohita TaxID=84645 RepID=A0A498MR20_LABRO|nr:hypothetical protein ROHU_006621 [Labeo rohita]
MTGADGHLRSMRLFLRCPHGRRDLMEEAEEEERDTVGIGVRADGEAAGAREEMDGEQADGVEEAEEDSTTTDRVMMDISETQTVISSWGN